MTDDPCLLYTSFLFEWQPDYVIDAIDTVTAKLHLAGACAAHGVPLLMCLGTGNRLDPSALRAGDIADTAGCGLSLIHICLMVLPAAANCATAPVGVALED